MPEHPKRYSPEYREEAVKLVIENLQPIAQVTRELGIIEGTLGNWVNACRREHAGDEPPLAVSDRARPARTRELENSDADGAGQASRAIAYRLSIRAPVQEFASPDPGRRN